MHMIKLDPIQKSIICITPCLPRYTDLTGQADRVRWLSIRSSRVQHSASGTVVPHAGRCNDRTSIETCAARSKALMTIDQNLEPKTTVSIYKFRY
ncbi:hypothetical protein RRG08_055459 [Elysia crispata]|uniref:Uncharacterized protein n=1 Tax=Elysia crispata TaxID=231223 RepID=A0AAE1AAS1_9GAST|nr:hypothetical protein RRG08_055459 [Elysia crispata]